MTQAEAIEAGIADYGQRAREGKLGMDKMQGRKRKGH